MESGRRSLLAQFRGEEFQDDLVEALLVVGGRLGGALVRRGGGGRRSLRGPRRGDEFHAPLLAGGGLTRRSRSSGLGGRGGGPGGGGGGPGGGSRGVGGGGRGLGGGG